VNESRAVVAASRATEAAAQGWRSRRGTRYRVIAEKTFFAVVGLFIFILALELLKTGARGLVPLLESLDVEHIPNAIGFGWLGAYITMSGSPVAAIALSLFSADVLDKFETFGMINGSRFGASFIVLTVGFIQFLRGRRQADGIYIGVVALLVAWTLYAPVVILGFLSLHFGWFDSIKPDLPNVFFSATDKIYDPIVAGVDGLPDALLFVLGGAVLWLSFWLFDRALPQLEAEASVFSRFLEFLQRRWMMFALGSLITLTTLSVSISLTLLIPLSQKGYVRRQHVIPYIMGANVTTWIDTLFAALLLDEPVAFTIVFTEMLWGAVVSLIVLAFLFQPYNSAILGFAHYVTVKPKRLGVFLSVVLVIPAVLLFLPY
jgi:hypothetical protein